MSTPAQIALAFGSVGILLALMAIVKRLAAGYGINAEVQRKLVHIGTGLYALTLPWLFPDDWPIYMLLGLSLVVLGVLRLPSLSKSGLGSTLHSVDRHSYGDFLLAISIGLCLFLSEGQMHLYVLPIAVLTLADAAAALAGSTYGTKFINVEEGRKSIEGSVIFFLITLVIAMMVLMLMTPLAPLNIIVTALMVAAFGTMVEASSWQGFDNLFLPMGLLIFLYTHANKDLAGLIGLAVLFTLSILAFRWIAPRMNLSTQAARVYVISAFMLLSFTTPHNAVIPILVLAAHAWCRTTNPSKAQFPDLDIVAGLATMSFAWLAVGSATNHNAVSFYAITAMGLTLGLCALAVAPKRTGSQLAALGGIALGLCAIRAWVITQNSDLSNWNGPMWSLTLASLALVSATTLLRPGWFGHNRVAKLTGLALALPAAVYLFSMTYGGAPHDVPNLQS